MCDEEIDYLLKEILSKACGVQKWKSPSIIPNRRVKNDYGDLHSHFLDFPSSIFTTSTGDKVNILKMIGNLLFMQDEKEINISICPMSSHDQSIGFKISFGKKESQIGIDYVQQFLSSLTGENVEISNFGSQSQEGMISVDNGNEIFLYSFDFDTFTINGYTSVAKDNSDEISISFVAKCDIFEKFQLTIWQILICMIYHPEKSLMLSLGSNALLLNIPKTKNRFEDLAKILFPGLSMQMYSHSESSAEIQATSTATIIFMVKSPNKNFSNSKSLTENMAFINPNVNSLFMLFSFINGVPQESNCSLSHDLLSSIVWSDLSISFIPLPNNSDNQIFEDEKFDSDFLSTIEFARKIPFATCSSIVNRPGMIIMAFVDTSKESAKGISRIALTEAFKKMKGVIRDKKKSYTRLNKIWESIDSISAGISSILEEEVYNDVWDACCRIQNCAYLKKPKIGNPIEDSQLI